MDKKTSPVCLAGKRKPLALGLLLALAATGASVVTDATAAATLTVMNCNDTGSGSLRATVGAAANGDTVNFSAQLPCSTISLKSGAIATSDNLFLTGPGADKLVIDGGSTRRVLVHSGVVSGATLTITDLTISGGTYNGSTYARGGCLFSSQNVSLIRSTVANCNDNGNGNVAAYGGGIYTQGDLYLLDSTITGNHATSSGSHASGGGAAVFGNLHSVNSTISANVAESQTTSTFGGGVFTYGHVNITGSILSGNQATLGAAWATFPNHASMLSMTNSTLSENVAGHLGGGIYTTIPLTITNSTIAFNQTRVAGGGVYSKGAALTLQSTIIADNIDYLTSVASDLGGDATATVAGASNLITSSTLALPTFTITTCPHLGPLEDHGGPTLTHALLYGSPAIDQGNNTAALVDDQRGQGYPRIFGAGTDIGAYELQITLNDRIYAGDFESGCNR